MDKLNEFERRLSAVEAKVGIEKEELPKCPACRGAIMRGASAAFAGLHYVECQHCRIKVHGNTQAEADAAWRALCRGWNDPLGRLIDWMEQEQTLRADDSDRPFTDGKLWEIQHVIAKARAIRDGRE
jgi:hypothetical protein